MCCTARISGPASDSHSASRFSVSQWFSIQKFALPTCAGAERIVVRVMLCAFADDVSLDRLFPGSDFGANAVATASPDVVRLNDVEARGLALL